MPDDEESVSLVVTEPPEYTATLSGHDVVILPIRVQDDVGIYPDEVLTLKKQLRAQGVDADFLHDSDHRRWLGLKGEVVATIILGFVTSGGVAAVQSMLTQRFAGRRLRLRAARRRNADGSVVEWFEADGSGDDVARALDKFLQNDD